MRADRETYRKTLMHAVSIAGGGDALAAHLKIDPAQLQRWIDGAEPIPIKAFLDAVDLVVDRGLIQLTRKPTR